jgi:uncharacterized membrane protein YfcA
VLLQFWQDSLAHSPLYLSHGYILPELAMPVMLGVLAASLVGSRLLVNAHVKSLRLVFSIVIIALGGEVIYSGVAGRL